MNQLPADIGARKAALALLDGALRKHRSIDDGFEAHTARLEPRDRAFARLLVATTLRRLGQIDAVLKAFISKKPADPVMDIMRLGAAQLLFLGTPPHAAVATSVAAAKQGYGPASGFVNAVLRRVSEKGAALVAAQDAARLDTPAFLWKSWEGAYGADAARAISEAHLKEPPLDLSVKDAGALQQWAADLGADVLSTGSLRLTDAGRVQDLKGFNDGAWWVQDAAAALPAKVLMHVLGKGAHEIIDLCAAPGGKTAQLAAAGHKVTAVDIAGVRLALLRENLTRLKLSADVVEADALTWRPAKLADAVLLDAPCTATGTIRRHPDLPVLKTALDPKALAATQTKLLNAAAAMIRPGGYILYSVCSLQPEERRAVVEAVCAADAALTRLPLPKDAAGDGAFIDAAGDLVTLPAHWPERGGLDGFYGALLQKCP
ncbi:MAG: RsmB/NOP family class I SAM-dependent RNA methyltransferase [Rhodospirillaceae bacterium]|jgi:16S rRNA (cytosine967-C5)-methyltransferase